MEDPPGLPSEEVRRQRFHRLVDAHRDTLLAIALRRCRGDRARADDLVQDTLLRAWQRLDTLLDDSRAGAWLCTILCRRWIDVCRKRSASIPVAELPEHPDQVDDPTRVEEPSLWEQVTAEDVQSVLDKLKEADRVVVRLHDLEHVPSAQIAQRLNIAYGTVGSRLFRAHRKLRTLLERRLRARRKEAS